MYGENRYGLLKYAQEETAEEAPEEYFVDLSRYVPPFIARIREMAEIYRTGGCEAGALRYRLEDLLKQCFVQTATWGLVRWEEVYGITTNLSLTHEQRREIILNKIRSRGTVTVRMIKEAAEAFCGGEAAVIEHPGEYRFTVRFIGIKGIPRGMQVFISMLEDIKPAHLAYGFEYRYTTWGELEHLTWGSLKGVTWGGIRVLEDI